VSALDPVQTKPDCKVIVGVYVTGLVVSGETATEKEIEAFDAILDFGTYPIFLASDTTFSLTVAESKKDSFTTMLELNAVIYVLYAKVSIKIEKFDPSKSKSVKLEFARR
jgi:hypothetical protein